MIPKAAVQNYVGAKRDSHHWIKALSTVKLWQAVNELRPRPRIYGGMRKHQLACFLLGVSYPQFAYWVDLGTGKTLITLMLLQYWWQCKKLKRAVIFVTSDKAFPTWEKQIKKFGVTIPYITLEGSSENKWRQLAEFGNGLIIVPYPGAAAMVTDLVPRKKKGKKTGRNRWKINKDLVARFWEGVNGVVIDESTRAANYDSLAFHLIEQSPATIRYALAGRPFGRDPTLLWSQHYLVDRGETLGPTLGMFREAFFTDTPNPWVSKNRQKYVRIFTFDKRKEAQLAKVIQHRSITYGEEECGDVPKWTSIIEEVKFPREAAAYYDKAVQSMIDAKGNMEVVKNVFLRMRQLSSGFLGFKDDETGEKAQVEFEENPKFDRLFERLDEMPLDRKSVVFYDYTYSGRKIYEEAKRLGFKPIWLWSGTPDYKRDLHNFENDPSYRLTVVNNRVGAFSLDGLQVANYCFFYESPVGSIDREQAEHRLRRSGQTRRVFQFDLVVKDTVDAQILAYHQEGAELMKVLLRNPSMLLRKGSVQRRQ